MKSFIPTLLFAGAASARSVKDMFNWQSLWHLPGVGEDVFVPNMGNATFTQLIDHANPSLGTFEQFYFYDDTHWKGPGSPVVFFTPGEANITGYQSYLSTNRTTGLIAQKIGAAVIVIEHRYWGTSTPFTDLTTANMSHLTLYNSVKDLTHFAKTAKLPFVPAHVDSSAHAVPWVMVGGSYSGALSAWTESIDPGTFWAYQASSAPVEAISDYWSYFLPVQQGMPKNCSKDVNLVIDHMDSVLTHGSKAQQHALKARFGLATVKHNDDFMSALQNGPWLWQGNQFYTGTGFYEWCDYVENAEGNSTHIPGAEGVGLEKALNGYAKWMREIQIPGYCEGYGYFNGTNNTECYDTYTFSNPMFRDTSMSNQVDRQWVWMTCNEPFGYWQDGAPANRPTIVSRLVTAEYYARQCSLYFPPGPQGQSYGIAKGKTEDDVNAWTKGWFIQNSTRLMYTNGGFDPWREATVSADIRPGGPLKSTAKVPVNVVPGGFHCSDLITKNGLVNAGAQAVIDAEVAQINEWVGQFYSRKGKGWKA